MSAFTVWCVWQRCCWETSLVDICLSEGTAVEIRDAINAGVAIEYADLDPDEREANYSAFISEREAKP